ncbi:MAG TPA: hypothetical protein VKH81_20660 [Candidatus Angelobacter sp.]|nr:hypothetical protein [Candidatus Angelobacter sp.]
MKDKTFIERLLSPVSEEKDLPLGVFQFSIFGNAGDSGNPVISQ